MLARGERVLVAVSGGPDSVGLLLVLARLQRKLGITLVAAHVNHRLRGGDADADEACAAAAAAALRVPFVRTELDRRLGRGGNLEARARACRYAALHRLAAAHACVRIATGHTRDDQAETVLMRLIRGSGMAGLAGIRARRRDGVVRPLLDCRRDAVAAVVAAAGLATRHDASNDDPRFLRTQVRARLLPLLGELNPAIADACAHLALSARAEGLAARRWADRSLAAGTVQDRLPVAWLAARPALLQRLLVRRWLARAGVPSRGLSARHVQAATALATSASGRAEAHLPGGWVVRRCRGALTAQPPSRAPGATAPKPRR